MSEGERRTGTCRSWWIDHGTIESDSEIFTLSYHGIETDPKNIWRFLAPNEPVTFLADGTTAYAVRRVRDGQA